MRSNTIEFIGAPGVGKSTIYRELCKTWRASEAWIYPEALQRNVQNPVGRFKNWVNCTARRLLKRNIQQSFSENGGLEFIQQNEELANFCWQHLNGSVFQAVGSLALRYRAIFYLYRDFCRHQAISEAADRRICILDEGLLQKSFILHNDDDIMRRLIDEYLTLLPLPQAVIWVDIADIDEVNNRIRRRQKITATHIGQNEEGLIQLSRQWQRMCEMMTVKLREYEVNILKIDGTKSIEENVSALRIMILDHERGV